MVERTSPEDRRAQPGPWLQQGSARWIDLLLGAVLTVVCLAALLATSHDYGMVWDEGHTVRRERILAEWFAWVAHPPEGKSRAEAFSPRMLNQYWPFSRAEPDGHPPFYAILGLAGWWVSHDLVSPRTAYRFGPMVLCALTVGALYYHLARRHGRLAGLTASLGLLTMPRAFSHAHYALYDMPVTCLWLLAQIAFINALRTWRWVVPFGVLLGLAAGTKFTGWFAPVAPLLWVLVFEGPGIVGRLFQYTPAVRSAGTAKATGARALAWGLLIAGLTLVLIQPPWWRDPIDGVWRFLSSNLTRSVTKPIPTLYWGEVYEFALPWHNTLVLTAITTPVFIVLLGILGMVACFSWRRMDKSAFLWFLSWLVLMVVRALPNAPGHDGVRLFLPSVASLAVLAGLGAQWLAQTLRRRMGAWPAYVLVAGALVEGLIGIAQLYPYTLSYYNFALGGLRGAEREGFELTYYWDTMGPEFLGWVREQSQTGELELRFPSSLVNLQYLREWGEFPERVKVVGFAATTHPDYILQRRRGVYYPYDWWLDGNGRPIFGVERQGVDLLRVYSFETSLEAFMRTRNVPVPAYLQH